MNNESTTKPISNSLRVVAAILHRQTKDGLLAFASANLFDRLGIAKVKWDRSPTSTKIVAVLPELNSVVVYVCRREL